MNEENKNETPTDAPPEGQSEDVYSASTRVGQAPAEILELIARANAESPAETAPPPGPPKVLIKTPPAIPVTDFSVPEAKTAPLAVVPAALSTSNLLEDDDWAIPDEDLKPPPAPPHRAGPPPTPVMPAAPPVRAQVSVPTAPATFSPQALPAGAIPPIAELAAPIPASPASAPEAPPSHPMASPMGRPVTPRADFAPAAPPSRPMIRPVTPRADFAPAVGAVLGLVDAPTGIPEERASAAKLVAAAPDPNVRVSRVDEDIFSVRNPPVDGADGGAGEEHAPGGGGAPAGMGADGAPPHRERFHTPQLGDPQVPSGNPNHLPIADAPNSMHVPYGEAKAPSRTPVGAIIGGLVVVVLLALGAIVFMVLKK